MDRLRFERVLWKKGVSRIAGVDEAGRGPLAGPVVAAAVVLPKDFSDPAIDDSKQVSPPERERLFEVIIRVATSFAIRVAEVEEINRLNILQATRKAMHAALGALAPTPEFVLIDHVTLSGLPVPQRGFVRGDARSQSIAAASILAKVWRDRRMDALAREYPGYGFEQNRGYATASHRQAIGEKGPCPEHRSLFLRRVLASTQQTSLGFSA